MCRIALQARLPQKVVGAGAFGQHGEIDGAQPLFNGEPRRLGEQPSDRDHDQRQQ